jgi:hypothetical protein
MPWFDSRPVERVDLGYSVRCDCGTQVFVPLPEPEEAGVVVWCPRCNTVGLSIETRPVVALHILKRP